MTLRRQHMEYAALVAQQFKFTCMMLTASAIVMTSTTLSRIFTTYSRRLKLSLCSITRYCGGFFFFVSFL